MFIKLSKISIRILWILLFFGMLNFSLGIDFISYKNININFFQIIMDVSLTLMRVLSSLIIAWTFAIVMGFLISNFKIIDVLSMDIINVFRHISPFAMIPFAIIWFGLGEFPIFFIMFITLFFPLVVSVINTFMAIDKTFLDEAELLGCGKLEKLVYVIFPLSIFNLIGQFRVAFGLGWSAIIAAEMLGVKNGMGFRLLDFRYLLKYNEMVIYLIIMAIIGILIDIFLKNIESRFHY